MCSSGLYIWLPNHCFQLSRLKCTINVRIACVLKACFSQHCRCFAFTVCFIPALTSPRTDATWHRRHLALTTFGKCAERCAERDTGMLNPEECLRAIKNLGVAGPAPPVDERQDGLHPIESTKTKGLIAHLDLSDIKKCVC